MTDVTSTSLRGTAHARRGRAAPASVTAAAGPPSARGGRPDERAGHRRGGGTVGPGHGTRRGAARRPAVVLESSDLVGRGGRLLGRDGLGRGEPRRGPGRHRRRPRSAPRPTSATSRRTIPELLDEAAMHRWLDTAPQAMEYWEQVGAISWEIIPDLADYHSEAAGALDVGRYLTNAVIDGSVLGEWRERLRVSPNFPVGMTYAEMHVKGRRSSSRRRPTRRRGRPRSRSTPACPPSARPTWRSPRTAPAATRSPSGPASWRASSPGCSASPASRSGSRPPSPTCSPTTSVASSGVTADRPGRPRRRCTDPWCSRRARTTGTRRWSRSSWAWIPRTSAASHRPA